jgi:3-hydroxyacyl-[acyl-carrier-protein] dehydratase
MKSNENLVIGLLPFGRNDRGQRPGAAATTRTAEGGAASSATPSQIRPVEDQPPEIQETTTAPAGAERHPAYSTERRPAARASKRRLTHTIAKGRHTSAAAEGRHTKGHPATPKTRLVMLMNDLYTIDHVEAGIATLHLNAEHPIFKGHFPDRPVLPGACQLQMIHELLSYITTKTYRLQKAAAIKFITPIDPRQSGTIRLNLQYDEVQNAVLRVIASIEAGETTCLKFNGIFQAE